MIDDSEVLEYLEHFGVKGMKWGQRNVRVGLKSPSPKTWSPEDKEKIKQVAKGVGTAAAIAVGTALAYRYLNKSGKLHLNTTVSLNRTKRKAVDLNKLMDMTKVLPRR